MTDVITNCFFFLLLKNFLEWLDNCNEDDEEHIPKEIVFCFDTDAVICFLPIKATWCKSGIIIDLLTENCILITFDSLKGPENMFPIKLTDELHKTLHYCIKR